MTTSTDYKKGQRAFNGWLVGHGLKLAKVTELGLQNDDGWEHFAWTLTVENNYTAYLNPDECSYDFPFKQGTGHTKKPTLVDIMSALLSDAGCVVGYDFTEFCDNLGYDRDSRKAADIYAQIQVSNGRLLKLFRTTNLSALLAEAQPLMEAAGL